MEFIVLYARARYDVFSPVFIHRMNEFTVTSLQIMVGHPAARLVGGGDKQQPLLLG